MEKSRIICDNDFLTSFLWSNEEELLITLFKDRLYIPDAVKTEIEVLKGTKFGNPIFLKFLTLLKNDIKVLTINLGSDEESLMEKIRKNFKEQYGKELGEGELQMITLAITQKATFVINTASNNLKDIVSFINSKQIDNITTMDALCLAFERNLKTFEELEEIKSKMLARKRKLPPLSIEEYYHSTYIKNKY